VIPQFETCLVCDGVRQEILGKLTILGFFGVTPNVDVALQHLSQPAALTFVLLGGPGDGTFSASFEVFDESEQRIIAAAEAGTLTATPNSRSVAIVQLVVNFGHPGAFALRCFLNGVPSFNATFRVSPMASAPEHARVF
jgi:hypothetical protein